MNKLLCYAKHYLFGLLTSCWNAGIAAVKINGGVTLAAAAAPSMLHTPDLREMLGVFAAAAIWEAIDYFDDHRLPTSIEGLVIVQKTPAPSGQVSTVAAAIVKENSPVSSS